MWIRRTRSFGSTILSYSSSTASSISREEPSYVQMDLFTDYAAEEQKKEQEERELQKERSLQEAMLSIRRKFGSNAILKGINLKEGATGKERNNQIGGHRS